MVKAVFDFLQIHREVILRDTAVVVENMLSITPEALDAVDVVFGTFINQCFAMTDHMVLSESTQGAIAPEGIGVIHRALAGARPDVIHQHLGGDRFDDLGVDPAFSLEETEDHALAGSTPTAFAFTPAAEIGLVQFDLSLEFAALQFAQVEQGFAQTLVDPAHHFDVQPQVAGQSVGRLQLVEPLQDGDLAPQPGEALRLAAATAFHIPTRGAQHLERTAENALATPQKVGRTAEMTVFPNCHRYLPYTYGYETP